MNGSMDLKEMHINCTEHTGYVYKEIYSAWLILFTRKKKGSILNVKIVI
jgi:hypothetical protein